MVKLLNRQKLLRSWSISDRDLQ